MSRSRQVSSALLSRVRVFVVFLISIVSVLPAVGGLPASAQGQPPSKFFPETGQTVTGRFLQYWNENGGLMQQGYPISGEMQQQSAIDGKTYTVQYFERAVFELHPENQPPNDVLLSLLGVLAYKDRYLGGAPGQSPNTDAGTLTFSETGKHLGGAFLAYFQAHGGVRQQGFPISEEFAEVSPLDGKTYTVQYFERAVFEFHPTNTPPYIVLLSQLGTFAYNDLKNGTSPTQAPVIPIPVSGGQYGPTASNRYLVWEEGSIRTSSGPIPGSFDVRALDLKTNKPITVSAEPGDQTGARVWGNMVVWQDNRHDTGNPQFNSLHVKDLSTGAETVVVSGTAAYKTPYIAGKRVSWVQGDGADDHIMLWDMETGQTKQVLSGSHTVGDLQMSTTFITWDEVDYGQGSGTGDTVTVSAYNLGTGETFVVDTSSLSNQAPYLPNLSLDGSRLAINTTGGALQVVDLITRARIELPYTGVADQLLMRGDVLLFSSSVTHVDVKAIDLRNPKDVLGIVDPVPNRPSSYQFTVEGNWLIFVDIGPQANPPRLEARALLPR